MSIRELTRTETAHISGASMTVNSAFMAMKTIESMGKLWASMPEYRGKDWRYVVATEPGLSAGASQFFDSLGVSGKNTLAMWQQTYG